MKNESLRICVPLPRAPADVICLCETPRLDGDKGRGRGLVTRGVFLGSGMFSVWNSFCAEFQREAVIPETGKCYKQYGNTWPLLHGAAAAASYAAAACCCRLPRENTHNWPCVCLFLIAEHAQSVSGGDLIVQMWPM